MHPACDRERNAAERILEAPPLRKWCESGDCGGYMGGRKLVHREILESHDELLERCFSRRTKDAEFNEEHACLVQLQDGIQRRCVSVLFEAALAKNRTDVGNGRLLTECVPFAVPHICADEKA